MDGIQFLARVRHIAPDTVRIMLTGEADLTDAIEAVNQGNIFQFLATNPSPPEMLGRAFESALEQYGLIQAERELLEHTLTGSVEVLSEILGLVNPRGFRPGAAYAPLRRVYRDGPRFAQHGGSMSWPPGCPKSGASQSRRISWTSFMRPNHWTKKEKKIFASHCAVAPRSAGQDSAVGARGPDGGRPAGPMERNSTIPTRSGAGAGLLKVAGDFDEQMMRGRDSHETFSQMRASGSYDPSYLSALQQIHVEESRTESLAR